MCQDSNTASDKKKAKKSEAAALMAGLTAEWEQQEGWQKIRRRSGGFRYICVHEHIYTRITEENCTFYAACLFLKDIFLSLGHILRWTPVHKSYRDVQPFFFSLTKKEAQTVLTSLSPPQISWRNILNRRWCTGLNKYINTISSLWHVKHQFGKSQLFKLDLKWSLLLRLSSANH